MSIDDIEPDTEVTMTETLRRLFAVAGCDPTVCHACERRIKVGMKLKLMPHDGTDEMCCAKCGEKELTLRDKRAERRRAHHISYADDGGFRTGGYSRPSKVQP